MIKFHELNRRFSRSLPAVLALTALLFLYPAVGFSCGQTVTKDMELTEDLLGCEGDGIIVDADGVTIDLKGHSIVGLRKERTAGIRVQGRKNVTIMNGTIASFERGIYLTDVEGDNLIEKVNINYNRYEGLLAYQSSGVRVEDSVFTGNTRAAIWIYDTDAELVGNLGLDNPNRTFYLSGGKVWMSNNTARGGAYYSAFTFANGYTPSDYSLQNNLADGVIGVGYLFAWGFAGSVTDQLGNSAVSTGGIECWTQEDVDCPIDLNSAAPSTFCGNNICEDGESVDSCSSDCGSPPEEICGDQVDNDYDSAIDCDDADCAIDDICITLPVPVPADCKLPGAACSANDECCTSDCRTSGRGHMGSTCR